MGTGGQRWAEVATEIRHRMAARGQRACKQRREVRSGGEGAMVTVSTAFNSDVYLPIAECVTAFDSCS